MGCHCLLRECSWGIINSPKVQTKQVSTNRRWDEQTWSICTVDSHSVMKNEALTYVPTGTNPENMLLSERDQTPETTQHESADMKCPEQAHPSREDSWSPGAGREGDGEITAKGQWA